MTSFRGAICKACAEEPQKSDKLPPSHRHHASLPELATPTPNNEATDSRKPTDTSERPTNRTNAAAQPLPSTIVATTEVANGHPGSHHLDTKPQVPPAGSRSKSGAPRGKRCQASTSPDQRGPGSRVSPGAWGLVEGSRAAPKRRLQEGNGAHPMGVAVAGSGDIGAMAFAQHSLSSPPARSSRSTAPPFVAGHVCCPPRTGSPT